MSLSLSSLRLLHEPVDPLTEIVIIIGVSEMDMLQAEAAAEAATVGVCRKALLRIGTHSGKG